MNIQDLAALLPAHPQVGALNSWMQSTSKKLYVKGWCGSAAALFLQKAQIQRGVSAVYILRDSDEAGYFYNDLMAACPAQKTYYFPSSYKKTIKHSLWQKDAANLVLRTEALNAMNQDESFALVTYPEALAEKVVDTTALKSETLHLIVGETYKVDDLAERLCAYGFNQVDFVYEPGQFSLRGSLIDVFSFADDLPYRIDFFGDDIDSIRTFDIENQLSVDSKEEIFIVSNTQQADASQLVPLSNFFNKHTLVAIKDTRYALECINTTSDLLPESELTVDGGFWEADWKTRKVLEWGPQAYFKGAQSLCFEQEVQPLFQKNFELVSQHFASRLAEGYRILVLSDNAKQTDRLHDIFNDRGEDRPFDPVLGVVHEGFADKELKLAVFTDHQLFERYHKYALKSNKTRAGKVVLSLKELMQFQIGDYVVHTDHGIGQFGGLIRTPVNGKMQEVIKLIYKDNAIIFVNIHSLHRISKYKSRDGEAPKLNKLGSSAWANLKEKTKKKVKDIARELISLYAKRKAEQGYCFSPDSYLQQELESSFIYEDTPDQNKATQAVKKDMESNRPMDRLICGDVGFGKTEIAIRAAFKAVCDNKQVAVLVPTTVLAFQHYKSFSRRLKHFPCKIDYLSRARKPAEVKEIMQKTAEGRIDILVGTHKLLGKDLKFKDLGLLVIDEEQKFGVSAKEKLKQIRVNVDTLTLTATPIPRTLQFSLMGARDLSVINTPPPNRYPVQTELIGFDEEVIKEAIDFEIARGGQVFFVNNRISNLPELEAKLHHLVPQARICVGHGQMDSEKLEATLLAFIHGEYDILLATSIIESGIDIPNVNTMFINGAQHFGLSDLHQLRGRVGRTNKKAYCYLITPPLSVLPNDARRRLQAIENFSDLGSGIHLAMQDLDIRGAGNILGGEQSGFISDMGFETYHRILDEAIHELRYTEFSDVFKEENAAELNNFTTDCTFESDLELLLPASYVQSVSERMDLYRRLDEMKDESQLAAFEQELTDRFGPMPTETLELIEVVRIRWMGMHLGIEKMTIKNNRLTAWFINNFNSPYYQSDIFNGILSYVMNHHTNTLFKEQNGKRWLQIDGITSIKEAGECFKQMQ